MIFKNNFEKFIFFKIPYFLFDVLPFFLITGPFLSDLSVSLIVLIFFTYCLKNENFSYFKNNLFYFFLLFYLYLLLNSVFNNQNFDSLKISLFYFRYGVFVIAIIALINTDEKLIKYFFYCIFFCFIILICDGFYQYFNGVNILGWENSHRTSSFFGDKKILGSYLSRLWPILFGLSIIFFKNKKKTFLFLILIFILSETLIFLSGDRTAFFFINLSALFVILLSKKLAKLRIITLLASLILLIIISFINPTAKERVIDQTLNQMNLLNYNKNNEDIYIFSKQHTHHYITAYKMFLDNKLFGVGVKNFRNFCSIDKYKVSRHSCSTHPHNTYIQILAEIGIIGFLFLVTVLFYFLRYVLKHFVLKLRGKYYFDDFQICILSGILIYLWPIIPTGNFFNNWLNIIMILNFPLLIWKYRSN